MIGQTQFGLVSVRRLATSPVMTKLFLSAIFLFTACSAAFPMAEALDLDKALRDADLIARVKVISVGPAPANSGYTHIARATIMEALKGQKLGESIDLLSDNGLSCPNVIYAVGDDCIVFARRRKTGHFDTMNAQAGRFLVEKGSAEFYPLIKPDPEVMRHGTAEQIQAEFRRKTPAEEIIKELRRRLLKSAK